MRSGLKVPTARCIRALLSWLVCTAVVTVGMLSAVCHAQAAEIVFSESGRIFAVARKQRIEVRSTSNGKILKVFMAENNPCQRIWFAEGDRRLLCGSRTSVDEWDFEKARIRRSWTAGMESFAGDMAYSRARQMFARMVFSGGIEIVKLASDGRVSLEAKPGENSARLAFSADGRKLAVLYESGTLRVWNTESAQLVSESATGVELPLWISFQGDSEKLVIRTERNFSYLNATTSIVTPGFESPLPIAYSDDGALFAYEDTVRRIAVVRDLTRGGEVVSTTPLGTAENRDGFDYGGAFSLDGARLAVLPLGSDMLTMIDTRRGKPRFSVGAYKSR